MPKPAVQPVNAKNTFRGLLTSIFAADQIGTPVVPTEIELLQTGEWDTPWHGKFIIEPADLLEYVKHFNDGVRKGVPIDLEHNSYSSDGASAWVEALDIRPTEQPAFTGQQSLWGKVAWTPAGEQKVVDREFRFFSPEFADEDYQDPETGEYMNNVLIGGGLTNRPLFKNLTAVRANEHTENKQVPLTSQSQQNIIYLTKGNDIVNLQDLLAKAPADLTDDEKAFVVENKADLTDGQVTTLTEAGVLEAEAGDGDGGDDDNGDGAGDGDSGDGDAGAGDAAGGDAGGAGDGDGAAGTPAGDKTGGKTITMSEADVKKLQADAAAGKQASEQLARKASEEHVTTLCFSDTNGKDGGKLPVAIKEQITEFYHGLSGKQRTAFDGIVDKLPSLKLFGQLGDSGKPVTGTAEEQVIQAADELQVKAEKAGKPVNRGTAIKQVLASDKELANRYSVERGDS